MPFQENCWDGQVSSLHQRHNLWDGILASSTCLLSGDSAGCPDGLTLVAAPLDPGWMGSDGAEMGLLSPWKGDGDRRRYSGPIGTLRALTLGMSPLGSRCSYWCASRRHFLVHLENKDKSALSIYMKGLMAPGDMAALFYKNFCVYLSSTILSHCLTWKLPPAIQFKKKSD